MKKHLTTAEVYVALDFYRPHRRVTYDGTLTNPATGEVFTPPRRVKQSHVAECDINTILKQYSQTGQLRHISANAQAGAYQDLPDNIDFQESMNIIKAGEQAFATLPARTRDRFNNNPALFLEFMADPNNQDEAIKLGLATRRPEQEPQPDATGGPQPPQKPPQPPQKPPQAPSTAPAAPKPPEGS